MSRTVGSTNKKTELPDEYKNIKHVVLEEIDPDYILFEDGRVFSKKIGDFKTITISKGYKMYTMNRTSFDIDFLIRKYFKSEDIIKEGGFVPIKDFDGYMINKEGQLYSVKYHTVISTLARTNTGWPIVCLMKDCKQHTKYVAKLVYNTFVGEIPEGYRLKFKNGRKSDCRLENLELEKIASHVKKQNNNNIEE